MTGLPSSIVKKYGIGKKAWAVFRSTHSRARRRMRSSAPMARKRTRRVGKLYAKARKRVRAFTASRFFPASPIEIGESFAYGYFRSDVVNLASPLINMVPAGDYADNVTLGLGAMVTGYLINNAYVRQAAKVIVLDESFLAGAKMRRGASLMTASTGSTGGGSPVLN